jgi:hypothetical protein
MDAGGRATHGAVAEEIFLVEPIDKRDQAQFMKDSG